MTIDEGRTQREAFRQDELLPMQEEFLTVEQFSAELNRTGIISQHANMVQELINGEALSYDRAPSNISPEVATALSTLELKLNYLIAMNLEKADDAEYDQRLVNLSATGIGFTTQEKCNKGDRLKVKINLPLFPPLKLELLGEVVSATANTDQNGTRIGVSFIYRCEQEEDAVVKYLFKRQRERIRTKYNKAKREDSEEELSGSGI